MADRDVTVDVNLRDKTGPGVRSAEKNVTSLDKTTKATTSNIERSNNRILQAFRRGAGGVTEMQRAARRLEGQIGDTARAAAKLRGEIAATGNTKLFRNLGSVERELGKLTKLRQAMSEAGADSAPGFAASFVGRVGPLLARAPVSAPLVAAIAAASPMIAATLSAGVLAGLAGGTVAAGVAVAFTDPRVKAEATKLGEFLSQVLRDATVAFVPATLGAMQIIRAEVSKLAPDLQRISKLGAGFVAPLTRGVMNLVRNALPGIEKALRKAGPVVSFLEVGLGKVGDAAGEAMGLIAEGAAGAGMVIGDMINALTLGLKGIGKTVGFLGQAYASMRLAMSLDKSKTLAEMTTANVQAAAFQTELDKLSESLGKYGSGSAAAAVDTRALSQAQRDAASAAASQYGAVTSLGAAIDAAAQALKENGRTHDENTAKGRANRDALQQLATAATKAHEETVILSGSQGMAQQQMQRSYAAFIRTAQGMGYTKEQAAALAAQMGLIPAAKQTTFSTPGLPLAVVQAKALSKAISSIDTLVEIQIIQRLSTRGQRVAGITGAGGHNEFGGAGSWRPAQVAAQFAAGGAQFAQGGGTSRTGGPVQVHSDISVSLDGAPFHAATVRAVTASERRQAWRAKVGRR